MRQEILCLKSFGKFLTTCLHCRFAHVRTMPRCTMLTVRFVRRYLQPGARPRMMLIRSNTVRTSQQKVLFNPRTAQNYEQVLQDLTSMLRLEHPPIKALFTANPPYRKVGAYSTHPPKSMVSLLPTLPTGR